MQEEINVNEIVKIEQMPKVFSQLEKIGQYIDEQIRDIDNLECTEENKQEIKKRRTEINNTLRLLDDRRKEIKKTLLEPYEIFNTKYEEECKDKLMKADATLKIKIDDIEVAQKQQKEEELREFYKEYTAKYNLESMEIPFEILGLNITLSASIKSLKEKIVGFCEKVANDLKLIELEEYKDEIMLEFKSMLDFASAKMKVIERHKQLELMKQKEEELARKKEEESKIVEKVEEVVEPEIVAPVEIETTTLEDTEEQYVISFTVHGTREQIMKLKQFLNEEGLRYE